MNAAFDIYSDTYYDTLNGTFRNSSETAAIKNYGSLTTFIRGSLVLLLRAGFVLVQLGSVPIENVYIILLQNILDIAVTIASFGLVGYILAFGYDSLNGGIGYGLWIISYSADLDNAILGFSACIIASAIVTTILSGRLHFVGYLLTSLIFSMLFQPIIIHWVWHKQGWMHRRRFMGHLVSVKDHAGALVVHITGGIVGLIGSLFLGRRLIKLSEISESSIGAESPGSTITGYIFVILGLIAFSLPAPSYELTHIPDNYIGLVLVNNIMAMAAGIIAVIVLQFLVYREIFNYWIILRCIQGAIAGMVAISAGVDVYNPVIAFAIGTVAAILFYFVAICVHNSSVEDYCNIIAIHLVCGVLGTLLPPILGTTENLGTSTTSHFRVIHLGWQLLSILTVSFFIIVIFTLHFAFLYLTGFLRNKSEEINHRRGVTASTRGPERRCLQRLFTLYADTPYIEPGTIGKSPEQFRSYEKTDFVVNSAPELQKNYRAKDQLQQPTDSVLISPPAIDSTSPRPRQPIKQRFVYTMSNVHSNVEDVTVKFDSAACRGDAVANGEAGDIKRNLEKLEEVAQSIGKQFSCYKLHRTRKYTNLFRNRIAIRKNAFRSHLQQTDLKQSPECLLHDNTFNDGFVTIKMPSKGNLSDGSD